MKRAASSDWPHVLTPEVGCYPPAVPLRNNERVLHIAIYSGPANKNIFRSIVESIDRDYREVCWRKYDSLGDKLRAAQSAAKELHPTIVFMQIQRPGAFTPEMVQAIRPLCAPNVVICDWDGDQHHEPADAERQWFNELGRVCDTSLVCNTEHPKVYAELGVNHPGYLQAAMDPYMFLPTLPAAGVAPIVMLARGGAPVHERRTSLTLRLMELLGPDVFSVYGFDCHTKPKPIQPAVRLWNEPHSITRTPAHAHHYTHYLSVSSSRLAKIPGSKPVIAVEDSSAIYCAAKAAVSISARGDLPRYTSSRLLRILASGTVALTEYFPDYEGLGLIDGVNCRIWKDAEEVVPIADDLLSGNNEGYWDSMRAAALALSKDHMWDARMPEFLAVVDAVRGQRHT